MDKKTFDNFRDFIYKELGISIADTKEALLSHRVGGRMRTLNIEDYRDYFKFVTGPEGEEEVIHLIDAVTTNVTSFFRENDHFEFIKTTVEQLKNQKQTDFRFWSAASSTGEEPYSIAMTLRESLDTMGANNNKYQAKILATDISTRVLKWGIKGCYDKNKIETIPAAYRKKYLEPPDAKNDQFQMKSSLKEMITFARLNLSDIPFPMKNHFDFILCRNVMIYFDQKVRQNLINEMHRLLKNGGFLLLGHSEAMTDSSLFKYVKPSIYQK